MDTDQEMLLKIMFSHRLIIFARDQWVDVDVSDYDQITQNEWLVHRQKAGNHYEVIFILYWTPCQHKW